MAEARRFQPTKLLSPAVVVIAAVALIAAALNAEGYQTPELELHDAGVWISWAAEAQVGRTNTQIGQVDVKVGKLSNDLELEQSDELVLVYSPGSGLLHAIDGRTAQPGTPVKLPTGSQVAVGGPPATAPTSAVLGEDGRIWVAQGDGLMSLGFPASGADAEDGDAPEPSNGEQGGLPDPSATIPGATHLAVGDDGLVRVLVAASGEVRTYDGSGAFVATTSMPHGAPDPAAVSFTVVGSTPVVLDGSAGRLMFGGSTVSLDESELGSSPELQLPGPDSDGVLVATDDRLIEVPFEGGEPISLTDAVGTGGAARPIRVGGCVLSAWSGVPTYAQICGERKPVVEGLSSLTPGGRLRFRTNRGKVVINGLDDGKAVVLADGVASVVDWSQAEVLNSQSEDAPPTESESDEEDPDQKPPVANDDTGEEGFGTRPDRAVVIDPMRNDSDPNDDVLVIEAVTDVTGGAKVEIIQGGLALQVTPGPGQTDTIRFRYVINDGTAKDDAAVDVEVHPYSVNSPPVLDPESLQTFVVKGHSVSHNVLAGAFDPDGDPVQLLLPMPAPLESTPGVYTAASSGTIVYPAPSTARAGDVQIPFVASDGMPGASSTTAATLIISVRDQAGQPPKARGDHAETVVGRAVVVDVLANDSDADGDALRVFKADSIDGAEVAIIDGKVQVRPTAPGFLRVLYSITDGTQEAVGQLRVDVREAGQPSPPIAVRDDVVLTAGAPGMVDVLANDSDADGDVLIVVSVAVPTTVKLTVEVVDHRYLRISSAEGVLAETSSFSYKVTDGQQTADGVVVVRPGPTTSADQYPTAVDDDVHVRAGNVAAFAVLANDSDPEGTPLRVRLPDDLDPKLSGIVFVQGDLLRFVAPSTPGSVSVPYQAVDVTGRATNAKVNISVDPSDVANQGPRPPDLTARTVAGALPIEIPIPVATMDPNGDAVTLLGVADGPPLHGSVTEVGGDRLMYVSDFWPGGFYGTDTFTYRVRDSQGAEATATIRVGVAAPPSVNSPPVAIDDEQQVSEGGQVRINVVRNDSDPDGDSLHLVDTAVGVPPDVSWSVETTDGNQTLLFDAKGLELGEEAAFTYEVTDGILTDRGVVRVTVADTENLPPVAFDDVFPATTPGRTVEVDVLENDIDPDGASEDLVVTDLEGAPPATDVAHGSLRFAMPSEDVALRYTVEDAFGGTSRGVLRVRALDETHFRPVAVYDSAEVDQGKSVTINVLENDEVSPGRQPTLVSAGEARHGTCEVTGADSITFTPEDGFVGLVGCPYTLSDGDGTDPTTMRAVGMLGVTVRRVGNTAPVFRAQPVSVDADNETTVDLLPAVTDPDGDDITFSALTGMSGSIDASFDGSKLTVRAGPDALTSTLDLTFDVSDGTDHVPGTVTVSVSQFSGSLAVLVADVRETPQRVAIDAIDVLSNDQPADTGENLTIIGVGRPVGAMATVSEDGRTIRFEPADDFHGETTFDYTVDDGTKRGDRQVTSTVTVNVIGFPDAPPAPTATQENRAITLSWGVPADNGAPITEYWVKASGGPVEGDNPRRASGNSITFDGLTNSTPYTFQIAAVNRAAQAARDAGELDDWLYSAPSIALEPNAKPPVPTNLTATYLAEGEAITLTWDQPEGEGRPPKEYDLQISPTPADGVSMREGLPVSAKDGYVVDGLVNGTSYAFQVRAINILDTGTQAEGVSEFSSAASEFPSTRPAKMAKPQVVPGAVDELVVSWTKPVTVDETGGAPIGGGPGGIAYKLYWYLNGAATPVGTTEITDPDQTSHPVQGLQSGEQYTFTVTATNRVAESDPSDPSDPQFAEDRPLGTAALSATDGDGSSVLTPSFPPKYDQGSAITAYQWRRVAEGTPFPADETGWTTYSPPLALGSGVPAANGGRWLFQLRACNSRGCSPNPGATSNLARPYTNPSAPTNVRGSNSGGSINWAWDAAVGNGRPVVDYEVTISGRGTQYTSGTSVTTAGYVDDGSRQYISVVARYGTAGPDASDTARMRSSAGSGFVDRPQPPPPPSPTATAKYTGDAFTTAGAGGTFYDNEIVAGSSYVISLACQRAADIGTNNGWWYQNAATGHWAAATLFTQTANEFNAPRGFGGGSSNCN